MIKLHQKILVLVLILIFAGPVLSVLAQETSEGYVPLASLPGTTNQSGEADLGSYVPGVVRIMIGLAVLAAVFVIVLGGFTYMSTDAITKKESGRQMINRALWGLGLALAAYLILYTINPSILEFNLNLGRATAPTGPSLGVFEDGIFGSPFTPEGLTEEEARAALGDGIDYNRGDVSCTSIGQEACTSVAGLPQNAINGLNQLQDNCNCNLTISGGTEYWLHDTHGPGLSIVDLRPTDGLNTYLGVSNPQNGQTVVVDGNTYTFESEGGDSTGDHWHVVF